MIQPLDWALAIDFSTRFLAAALVGAVLALHPARIRHQWGKNLDWSTVESQILLTVAGAIMVVMVGESLPRAFGLLGLGSLIRFRVTMNSPRDTALLLVLIGLGMGCGTRLYPIVGLATVFVFLLLFLLEFGRQRQREAPPFPEDEGAM